ncbi:MAG: serine--tRNA ligase [Deltaproteobacteria bacterium]|jgi:seryl-tRNA synthetase|nr:serine--tRNA ligase [Deltaproteobacteria bacterium]
MLDPRILESRRDEIVASCKSRRVDVDVDAAIAAQRRVTEVQTELNRLNERRNAHQAAGKRKLEAAEREAHVAEGRQLKEQGAALEKRLADERAALQPLMLAIPNFLHPDSPQGGEADFNELRRVGEPRVFDFQPLDHMAISEKLDLFDFEAGAKVSGQKWYFLKNEAVLLELALQRMAIDYVMEAGFAPFATPDVARKEIVDGLAFSPRGSESQIYSIEGTDLDLIGTAEITLGGINADSLLDEADLPLRMSGISHCFRTEAGSAGRESKGLYRVHQFTKVEMFAITRPEDSASMHEEIVAVEERLLQALELPYRVLDIAAGDLGAPAYRKFDIEGWMPMRGDGGDYGELTSASNCTDYQARRLKTRFRRADVKKNEFVHTLNGTAIAVPRTIVAILENHQRSDGSVAIPAALQSYLGLESIGPR